MKSSGRYYIDVWASLGELLILAAEESGNHIRNSRRKHFPHRTIARRHPGEATPLWNAVAEMLQLELQPYGSKSRLARFLGVPPQRVSDWLRGRRRLPNAETLLQILYWLNESRAGRDPAIQPLRFFALIRNGT
jgi:transcriptional regulator with XRE-family HTH domain